MVRSQKKFILAFSMVSLSLSLVLIQTINKISFIVPVWRNWPSESNERKITSFISFSPKAFHFFSHPIPFKCFFLVFYLFFFLTLSFAQWTFASLLFAPQCDQEHFCKSSSLLFSPLTRFSLLLRIARCLSEALYIVLENFPLAFTFCVHWIFSSSEKAGKKGRKKNHFK